MTLRLCYVESIYREAKRDTEGKVLCLKVCKVVLISAAAPVGAIRMTSSLRYIKSIPATMALIIWLLPTPPSPPM